MSLVSSVLNGVRYDLRNYADADFDVQLMLHYLNRSIKVLDYTLGSHNSDWTLNRGTVTLAESDDTVAVPTGAFNLREVWISDDRLENLRIMELYYKAEFRDDEAQPNFWVHDGANIRFECDADDDYTIIVFYDKYSTVLTLETDTMPYSGTFDETLREATVLMCEAKKYKNPTEADAMYAKLFESVAMTDMVNRRFKKKNYRLDF